ncbi:MAG: DNA double-strand break repair nuclease NurA [Candidatus Hodarchaeales archaeon]|jgi:hypothetical protein
MSEVAKFNSEKVKFCEILRSSNPDLTVSPPHIQNQMLDKQMITKLLPQDISGLTIGGIDGGYVSRSLIGFDIFFFRAIAVFSTYTPRGIQRTSYYPSKIPSLEVAVSETGLSSFDFETMGSIRRAITELQVASQILERTPKKLDILLLDGSPVMRKPLTSNSKILKYYQTYISILSRLIFQSREDGIKIAWIVKDSRINLFTKFLGRLLPFLFEKLPELLSMDYRRIINRSRDMDLFYYLLESNFRSFSYNRQFKMSKEFGQNFTLYAFYLKTAPFDIPLRIELFQNIYRKKSDLIKEINTLAEAILPLSQYNKSYGIPAPIVEADARSKIKEAEVDALFQLMRIRHPTPNLWYYRRKRSPWKF